MKKIILAAICLGFGCAAMAKLPPLSDEARLKAEQAKAKTAWSDKVAAFKLCLVQDKTAATYLKKSRSAAPAGGLPPCQDPGAFVMPEALAAAPAATVAAATPAAPAPGTAAKAAGAR